MTTFVYIFRTSDWMVTVDFIMRLLSIIYVLMHICDVEIDYKKDRITKKTAVFKVVFDVLAMYIFVTF